MRVCAWRSVWRRRGCGGAGGARRGAGEVGRGAAGACTGSMRRRGYHLPAMEVPRAPVDLSRRHLPPPDSGDRLGL